MVRMIEKIPNLVGRSVERYTILSVLGSGAFGIVYRAVDNSSAEGKQFALKCLARSPQGSQYERAVAREWSIQSQLCGHSNIITLHRFFELRDFVFFVFDFCEGGDLYSAITETHIYQGKDKLIKRAFLQLLDAVEHCHRQGIAHRDLKPENVLCSSDGSKLYLTDFGLASRRLLSSEHGVGSAFYMSPECIGREIKLATFANHSSDVWSLGVILCNMVTGRCPWRSAVTDDECFSSYLHNSKFLLETLPISKELCTLFGRVFTLNPFCRIGLPQFRAAVEKMDRFSMTAEELGSSTDWCKAAAAAYAREVLPERIDDPDFVIEEQDIGEALSSNNSIMGRTHPDGIHVFASPEDEGVRVRRPKRKQQKPVDFTPRAVQKPLSEDSTPSSAPQSDGPITPETHAVDDVDVDIFTESLSHLAIPPPRLIGKGPTLEDDIPKYHGPSRARILRNAVQILKA
ncbi:Pkinase-domain-containing protein [Artomyces pyxidatus]|uniref:Pkinase-domain-containing protein n=1 Tax=Artomyces pyxidatus TaxID=48021 RepID=A0ACB8TK47_9AGAM|nr:Pkinase-domain-containing protein [Artomyces pyxidatus]